MIDSMIDCWVSNWVIDQMIGWVIDWITNQLIKRLSRSMTVWLGKWFNEWLDDLFLIEWLSKWLIYLVTGWVITCLIGWWMGLISQMIDRCFHWLIDFVTMNDGLNQSITKWHHGHCSVTEIHFAGHGTEKFAMRLILSMPDLIPDSWAALCDFRNRCCLPRRSSLCYQLHLPIST